MKTYSIPNTVKWILLIGFFIVASFSVISMKKKQPEDIALKSAAFKTGDDNSWSNPAFDDSDWSKIDPAKNWEQQGFENYDGMAWYRFKVVIPSSLKSTAEWKDSLSFNLGQIANADESFLNGIQIGKTGTIPAAGIQATTVRGRNTGTIVRNYRVASANPAIRWDQENILAVRVYNNRGNGGFSGTPSVGMLDRVTGIKIALDQNPFIFLPGKVSKSVLLQNTFGISISGTFNINAVTDDHKVVYTTTVPVNLSAGQNVGYPISFSDTSRISIQYTFTETKTRKTISTTEVTPYILTPAVGAHPRINGARVFGVRPGSPFIFKIPATGKAPLTYQVQNLPKGLTVDAQTGIITGAIAARGEYKINFVVKNGAGQAKRDFTIKVGDLLALTPPMGWNSWNAGGLTVSDEKVRSSANSLLQNGLQNHGWTYINVDDGWESPKRAANGEIVTNEKFPDMKALSTYLHQNGLKFGVYSSPGPTTCGGYMASYQHEVQDATSYASWGVDYLKYDICSYRVIMAGDTTLAGAQKPFYVMRDALQQQNRDIVYSLSQYGQRNIWAWGRKVNGNLWRTTGDITDTWASLYNIGFTQQEKTTAYTAPGSWNDPDMLVIGYVGWGNLHNTRLTPDEQYTHISLWSMLSAPLLLGCDLSKLDAFTLNLITNDEVIAVDQDPKASSAKRVLKTADYEVWVKDLEDGSKAVGLFNTSATNTMATIDWKTLGINGSYAIRDLWRQKDLAKSDKQFTSLVPLHGVRLIKIKKN